MEREYTVNDILYAVLQIKCKYGRVFLQDIVKYFNANDKCIKFHVEYLLENGFIEFDMENRISLTQKGEKAAVDISECRRYFYKMFLKAGVREDIAKTDAENIEAVISHHTFEKLMKAQI